MSGAGSQSKVDPSDRMNQALAGGSMWFGLTLPDHTPPRRTVRRIETDCESSPADVVLEQAPAAEDVQP